MDCCGFSRCFSKFDFGWQLINGDFGWVGNDCLGV